MAQPLGTLAAAASAAPRAITTRRERPCLVAAVISFSLELLGRRYSRSILPRIRRNAARCGLSRRDDRAAPPYSAQSLGGRIARRQERRRCWPVHAISRGPANVPAACVRTPGPRHADASA